MYHVINRETNVEVCTHHNFEEAKETALKRRIATGKHYIVEKRDWVWSTKTLSDLKID